MVKRFVKNVMVLALMQRQSASVQFVMVKANNNVYF